MTWAEQLQAQREALASAAADGKVRIEGNHAYPACFASHAQFLEWLRYAIVASRARNNAASPCSDCAPSYRQAMAEAGRCHEVTVRAAFRVVGRSRVDDFDVTSDDADDDAAA